MLIFGRLHMSSNKKATKERSVRLTERAHLKLAAAAIDEETKMSERVETILIGYLAQNLPPLFPPSTEKLHTYTIYLTNNIWKRIMKRGRIQNKRSASSEVEQAIRAKYGLKLVKKQS